MRFISKTKVMTKIFLLISALLLSSLPVKSQTESLVLPGRTQVKRGTVYYLNGEIRKFNSLNFKSEKIYYTDLFGKSVSENLSAIDHIDKRIHRPGTAALVGGVSGAAVGLLAGSIAYPDRSFWDWLIDEINGEDYESTIKKEQIPIIAGCTLAGAGIGVLVGLSKKEKTIYRGNASLDVFPGMTATPGEPDVFSMHLVIHIQ